MAAVKEYAFQLRNEMTQSNDDVQFLRSCTQTTWGSMFRHEVLSKEPVIIQMAVKYLKAAMTNLVKVSEKSFIDLPFPRRFCCCTDYLFFFPLSSQDSHRRTTARLVSMPAWTSTATRTSMLSFIVSRLLVRCRDCSLPFS